MGFNLAQQFINLTIDTESIQQNRCNIENIIYRKQ